jgi:hypothetical protein
MHVAYSAYSYYIDYNLKIIKPSYQRNVSASLYSHLHSVITKDVLIYNLQSHTLQCSKHVETLNS